MQNNKLEELAAKLYDEGLSKGRQEAEQMKADARKEAAALLEEAREKARQIVSEAQKAAEELQTKAQNDIRMAADQSLAAVRQRLEHAVVTRTVADPVTRALDSKTFMESLILTVAQAFNPAGADSVPLTVLLPENKREELDGFLKGKLAEICGGGLKVSFSKNIANGFRIGPSNDGYLISFTDEDFTALIAEYLRPKPRKLLFGA